MSVWPTFSDVGLTLLRWLAGWTTGALLGLALASAEFFIGDQKQKTLAKWMSPLLGTTLDFLRALPIIALVPIIQTLGVEERWKVGLIAWAVTFPVWLAVRESWMTPLPDTELALLGSGLPSSRVFWDYRLPKVLGGFLKGCEISIGIAWLSVVAAEWIGTYSRGFWAGGLGYKIMKAHDANSWPGMLACLFVFGILGTITAWLWRKLLPRNREITPGFNPLIGYAD